MDPAAWESKNQKTHHIRPDTEYAEDCKIVLRNIRRDAMENFKKALKNKEITEDDMKAAEKDIQDLTDKSVAEVDKLTKKKEDEILEV